MQIGFNPDYLPIIVIDPLIRSESAGNVPASWQLFNAAVTPGDVDIRDASSPASGIPVFGQPSTAAVSPAAYYTTRFLADSSVPHRASAAVRGAAWGLEEVGSRGRGLLGLIYDTRVSGDGFTTEPCIFVGIQAHVDTTKSTFDVIIPTENINQNIPHSGLTEGRWYRVGVEVLGTTVNVYVDDAGETDPSLLIGDGGLVLLTTFTLSVPITGHLTHIGFGLGGANSATVWSGCGDLLLEALTGPSYNLPPGVGGMPFPSPGIDLLPWGTLAPSVRLPGGQVSGLDFSTYRRYKAIRQAGFVLNNLQVGP